MIHAFVVNISKRRVVCLSNKIDKLHKQAVDYVEKQESLGKQQSDNTFDKGLVKELIAGLLDDNAIESIGKHGAVLEDDAKTIQEGLSENADAKADAASITGEYLSALENNLDKIEQIGQISDLVKDTSAESSTKKRISELDEIKKLLGEESQTTTNEVSFEMPRSQILETPQSQSDNKSIAGFTQPESDSYKMNSPKTIEHIKDQMGDNIDYFDNVGMKSGTDPKIELIPKGEQYYLTGDGASGNFLSKDNPGSTVKERQENLQLPPENDGGRVRIVESTRAHLGVKSTITSQEKWADKVGYASREGIKQTFTPNKNKNGAIADGIYKVVDEMSDTSTGTEIYNQNEYLKTERNSFVQRLREMPNSDSKLDNIQNVKVESVFSDTDTDTGDNDHSPGLTFTEKPKIVRPNTSQGEKKTSSFREGIKVKFGGTDPIDRQISIDKLQEKEEDER